MEQCLIFQSEHLKIYFCFLVMGSLRFQHYFQTGSLALGGLLLQVCETGEDFDVIAFVPAI